MSPPKSGSRLERRASIQPTAEGRVSPLIGANPGRAQVDRFGSPPVPDLPLDHGLDEVTPAEHRWLGQFP